MKIRKTIERPPQGGPLPYTGLAAIERSVVYGSVPPLWGSFYGRSFSPRGRKGKILQIISLTALCLFSLSMAACRGNAGVSGNISRVKAASDQQVFRWSFPQPDISSFDPGVATDATSLSAIAMNFTGLVAFDNNLQVQPQMAQSYDVSADKLTYTFHLRPNLRFSDGTRLDANDVAYSIDRALSPPVNNQSGVALTYLGLIQGAHERVNGKVNTIIGSGVIVQDPNTLIIKTTQPAAYFLGALAYSTSYVVEKRVIDKWGAQWTDHLSDNGGQGGAGPFKVKKYDHSTGIQFVPNPYYYGPKPQLAEVDYLPYKDPETSYNAYFAGQVDMTGVPPANYAAAKGRHDFSSTAALTIFYIGMNYKVRPLDNIKVRQGLALALNKDVINQAAYSGAYNPGCHIVPKGMYGYNPRLTCPLSTTPSGDVTKARQVFTEGLREEGLTPATFPSLTMTYPSQDQPAANEVVTIQQLWKHNLGISINTTTVSQGTMYTLEAQTTGNAGPLQLWLAGWGADYPDPQDWITLQFGSSQSYNSVNYGDNPGSTVGQQQALQKQMVAADAMMDQDRRAQVYNRIEQQLVNDVAWLPMYQRPDLRLLQPYVVGLKFNAFSSFPPNSWGNIYITRH